MRNPKDLHGISKFSSMEQGHVRNYAQYKYYNLLNLTFPKNSKI